MDKNGNFWDIIWDVAAITVDVGIAIHDYATTGKVSDETLFALGTDIAAAAVPGLPAVGVVGRITAKGGKEIAEKVTQQSVKSVEKAVGKKVHTRQGIYEFSDTAGKKYVGQSVNVPKRLKQHERTGKLDPNQIGVTTEVLGGKTAREIAGHKRIQDITNGVPARRSSAVSNKVDPIGPNRKHLLDD